jgi:hypothetical protein
MMLQSVICRAAERMHGFLTTKHVNVTVRLGDEIFFDQSAGRLLVACVVLSTQVAHQ